MQSKRRLRNHYKTLGIDRSASFDEIRSAYHRLAKIYHPDDSKVKDSEYRMQLINEAYGVLGDKSKKAFYDYVFFADNKFYSQSEPKGGKEVGLMTTSQAGRFRYIISNFIVSIIGFKGPLDLILVTLVFIPVFLFTVFGLGELAGGIFASFLILGAIFLMIRILVEIANQVGIREEDA
jgi:hypothetical protein